MAKVHERLYVDAPFTQTLGALEARLGITDGRPGTSRLTLVLPISEHHDIVRTVDARSARKIDTSGYTSRFQIAWQAGATSRGLPTPGFTGDLVLSAGEDYAESLLQIEGSYDPPGGLAGRAFDEAVGRRIAHATLAALLAGIGDELRADHLRLEAAKGAR